MAQEIVDQSYLSIEINTISGDKYNLDVHAILKFTHTMSVNYLCDFATIVMKDFGSLLTEILPLTGKEKVIVKYGENKDDYNEIEFDIFSIHSKPQSPIWPAEMGQESYSINAEVEIVLINRAILSLTSEQKNRAFRKKTVSEVASIIASEIPNVSNTIIEDTIGEEDIIQPYWTNGQLLRHLARYARSNVNNIGGYMYFIDRNIFHFHTYEHIMSEEPYEELTIARDHVDKGSKKSSSSVGPIKYDHYGILEIDYKINNHFYLSQGGANSVSAGYDFELDKYIKGTSSLSTSKQKMTSLGDSFSVKSDDIPTVGRFLMTGDSKQSKVDNSAETRHLWPFYDIIKSRILCRGKIDRMPAKLVKIILPSTSQSREVVDSFHSGLYFVDTVSHFFQQGAYYNKIVLSRNSYNSLQSSDKAFFEDPVKKKIGTL